MKIRVVLLALALAGCQQEGSLEIQQAWVREGPPNARMLAAYATFSNGTDAQIAITGFSSSSFELVELHQTQIIDGVSRMRQQSSLVLPPGAEIRLEPGGLHLMLMRPTAPVDGAVTIQFETAQGGSEAGVFRLGRP